ncbi:hypothetical protein L1D52_24165 [Vibrio brasiliensis]|uniref:hypothetical protein n=1 Tax=Vibrio brasiliensis TaxID=170652 RepID=UPI001EFC9A38|nr:hypothetical protein [Vibrio brasiliensis]MCG9785408.1 hypothetical protein [Vibrio brasiliensis]
MKNIREDKIIIEHTREWLQNSNYTQAMFATQMLAPNIKEQEPETVDDYNKWHTKICQRVSVVMTYKQAFPLQWKWAWLAALPEDVRKPIESELAAMAGYLHTMPELAGAETVEANTAEIYTCFSHLVQNSEPAHDGVYDQNDDREKANQQIDATLNLIENLANEVKRVHAGTGATGRIRNISELDDILGGLCTQNSNEK